MPTNYINIPLCLPFKFVPVSEVPGLNFDDSWAMEQFLSTEVRAYYKQKWQRSETTPLYIESSITPEALQVLKPDGTVIATFPWTVIFAATNYRSFKTTFDFSSIPDNGIYFLRLIVTGLADAISEPIHVADKWPGTRLFSYRNSFNDFDVTFTADSDRMNFRVEAAIPPNEVITKRNAVTYINQKQDPTILNSVPSRIYRLHVGDLLLTPECRGVAPWVIDLMERIFACDDVLVSGKALTAIDGADFEKSQVIGYPLVSGVLEVADSINLSSLQFQNAAPEIGQAIVLGYEVDTGFFGPGNLVPVLEVQENS